MPDASNTYRLIGIDPGTNVMGYAIIEVRGRELRLMSLDVVRMNRQYDHAHKLAQIVEELGKILDRHRPRQLAIEAPFYGKNIQSMLKLGRAQGVAMATALTRGIEIAEYSPRKIKQAITGNGNASKEQVAALLGQILKQDLGAQTLDATDALAVAVCHFFQQGRSGSPGAGSRYKGWKSFLKENPDRKSG